MLKVMYGNRLDDGKKCFIIIWDLWGEAVQHLRSGNAGVYGTRRRPLVALTSSAKYKQTNVYTNAIEISVILIKQSLWLIYKLFRTLYMSCNVISQKPINHWPLNTFLLTYYLLTYLLKSNPGNPVPATGYPVPKPVPTSNH